MLLNQARTHSQPMAGCEHMPGFLKLFTISVCCMYVRIFVCLSAPTWTDLENSLYTNNKRLKKSLYYTHVQVSSASKVCFFPNQKLGVATFHRLQGWWVGFLFRCCTTEKQRNRPNGHPGNAYLVRHLESGRDPYKNEEQPRGFAGRIVKEYHDRKTIKQLRRYFLCIYVLFWSNFLNMHPWQRLTYFGKS